MARYFTSFVLLALFLASTVTHSQQGNMPVPVQKLPPYPPTVCVAPNWTTLSCDSRAPAYGPQNEPSGWQCDNVKVTEIVDSTVPSMEFLITGIERRDNRFKLEGFDRLYLNGKLCTRFKPQEIRFEIPVLLGSAKCLTPDGMEEPCESRHEPRRTTTVLYEEPGGDYWVHWNRFRVLAESGNAVEIRGPCASSCTLIMVHVPNDRLCFGEIASLKFHVARDPKSGEPNMAFTQRMMVNQYPQDIRKWIMDKGGVEKMNIQQMWTLDAAELWQMGYRRCGPEPPPEPEAPPVPMTKTETAPVPQATND
jgi:hypothetical protein